MTAKTPRYDNAHAVARLKRAGLRPTRQRIALTGLLFRHGDRHIGAEALHSEAIAAGIRVSLATVYNTLHQFTAAGILRQVVVEPARSYFDTNTGNHQHFYNDEDRTLIDIPDQAIAVSGVPQPPKGTAIERVDVVIRVRRA